jgi:hypothetical protein
MVVRAASIVVEQMYDSFQHVPAVPRRHLVRGRAGNFTPSILRSRHPIPAPGRTVELTA